MQINKFTENNESHRSNAKQMKNTKSEIRGNVFIGYTQTGDKLLSNETYICIIKVYRFVEYEQDKG